MHQTSNTAIGSRSRPHHTSPLAGGALAGRGVLSASRCSHRAPPRFSCADAAAPTAAPASYEDLEFSPASSPAVSHAEARAAAAVTRLAPPPWSALHARVLRDARDRRLFSHTTDSKDVLLAVSGGQDSACLLRLMMDLKALLGVRRLAIAHCDHRTRPDSAANAAFVARAADAAGLECLTRAAAGDVRSEAAARAWRYDALAEMAAEARCGAVATGHTASDRAETLLFNLVRGGGVDGMRAMRWQRPLVLGGGSGGGDRDAGRGVRLVRPMLGLTRRQTGAACAAHDLATWHDATNDDERYARNYLRGVLGGVAARVNARAVEHLAAAAELADADVEALEAAAAELLGRALAAAAASSAGAGAGVGQSRDGGVSAPPAAPPLQRQVLAAAPLALQRRALRQWLAAAGCRALRFDSIESVVKLLTARSGGRSVALSLAGIAVDGGERRGGVVVQADATTLRFDHARRAGARASR